MVGLAPRIARYGLTIVLLSWAALAQFSVVVFGYQLLRKTLPGLPAFSPSSIAALATNPIALAGLAVAFVASAVVGRRRYGSLSGLGVAATKRVDGLLGASLFDEPTLVGRLRHDGVAWRLAYWADDRVDVRRRECPFCGLELTEAVLPSHVVHGENTAFNPSERTRDVGARAWEDVFGSEKADDRAEELALACPECNFSVPGTKEILEGADGAKAKFRRHLDHVRAGNPPDDPFAGYADRVRAETGSEARPEALWDAYVAERDDEDLLRIGLGPGASTDGPDPGATAAEDRESTPDGRDRNATAEPGPGGSRTAATADAVPKGPDAAARGDE